LICIKRKRERLEVHKKKDTSVLSYLLDTCRWKLMPKPGQWCYLPRYSCLQWLIFFCLFPFCIVQEFMISWHMRLWSLVCVGRKLGLYGWSLCLLIYMSRWPACLVGKLINGIAGSILEKLDGEKSQTYKVSCYTPLAWESDKQHAHSLSWLDTPHCASHMHNQWYFRKMRYLVGVNLFSHYSVNKYVNHFLGHCQLTNMTMTHSLFP
jgi:hypothetical protein